MTTFDKTQAKKMAERELFVHSYQHARPDPNNCAACALATKVPNYSGWPLLFIATGMRMHKVAFGLELADAALNNRRYFDNIVQHLDAFGHPGFQD